MLSGQFPKPVSDFIDSLYQSNQSLSDRAGSIIQYDIETKSISLRSSVKQDDTSLPILLKKLHDYMSGLEDKDYLALHQSYKKSEDAPALTQLRSAIITTQGKKLSSICDTYITRIAEDKAITTKTRASVLRLIAPIAFEENSLAYFTTHSADLDATVHQHATYQDFANIYRFFKGNEYAKKLTDTNPIGALINYAHNDKFSIDITVKTQAKVKICELLQERKASRETFPSNLANWVAQNKWQKRYKEIILEVLDSHGGEETIQLLEEATNKETALGKVFYAPRDTGLFARNPDPSRGTLKAVHDCLKKHTEAAKKVESITSGPPVMKMQ